MWDWLCFPGFPGAFPDLLSFPQAQLLVQPHLKHFPPNSFLAYVTLSVLLSHPGLFCNDIFSVTRTKIPIFCIFYLERKLKL